MHLEFVRGLFSPVVHALSHWDLGADLQRGGDTPHIPLRAIASPDCGTSASFAVSFSVPGPHPPPPRLKQRKDDDTQTNSSVSGEWEQEEEPRGGHSETRGHKRSCNIQAGQQSLKQIVTPKPPTNTNTTEGDEKSSRELKKAKPK